METDFEAENTFFKSFNFKLVGNIFKLSSSSLMLRQNKLERSPPSFFRRVEPIHEGLYKYNISI
jgi:hypothetical protein